MVRTNGKRHIKGEVILAEEIKRRDNKCIVIGAGDFSLSEINVSEKDLCIAVDGGYVYCKIMGIIPDIIIGDMDSVDEGTLFDILAIEKDNPDKVIRLTPEKDDTDMLAALKIGMSKGYKDFIIYGAMGGRIEHTIANIQCLSYLKNNGCKAYIMDENVMMTVVKDETVNFNKAMEGYMSLFALGDKATGVTIKGMKYLLNQTTITNDYPIGISNEFTGAEGSICVEKGMLLIIITW